MDIVVCAGRNRELPCRRRDMFGARQEAGWGEARPQRVAKVILATRSLRRGFRGGVAGAEPPHKGGPNRPDRPELQFLVDSF